MSLYQQQQQQTKNGLVLQLDLFLSFPVNLVRLLVKSFRDFWMAPAWLKIVFVVPLLLPVLLIQGFLITFFHWPVTSLTVSCFLILPDFLLAPLALSVAWEERVGSPSKDGEWSAYSAALLGLWGVTGFALGVVSLLTFIVTGWYVHIGGNPLFLTVIITWLKILGGLLGIISTVILASLPGMARKRWTMVDCVRVLIFTLFTLPSKALRVFTVLLDPGVLADVRQTGEGRELRWNGLLGSVLFLLVIPLALVGVALLHIPGIGMLSLYVVPVLIGLCGNWLLEPISAITNEIVSNKEVIEFGTEFLHRAINNQRLNTLVLLVQGSVGAGILLWHDHRDGVTPTSHAVVWLWIGMLCSMYGAVGQARLFASAAKK